MERYDDKNGNSGVLAYQAGNGYIIVQFKVGQDTFYKYTDASAGSGVIEILKSLARQGYGLNSYISKNKPDYSSKAATLSQLS